MIELLGGLLIIIGLFTSITARSDGCGVLHGALTGRVDPLLNRGELAALYSFVFLFFATRGSGIWSIDALRAKTGTE